MGAVCVQVYGKGGGVQDLSARVGEGGRVKVKGREIGAGCTGGEITDSGQSSVHHSNCAQPCRAPCCGRIGWSSRPPAGTQIARPAGCGAPFVPPAHSVVCGIGPRPRPLKFRNSKVGLPAGLPLGLVVATGVRRGWG